MSHVPTTPVAELEHAVNRAERAEGSHLARCAYAKLGVRSDCCRRYMDRVITAYERLHAARSQVPERHIPTNGAQRRQAERERLEAQYDDAHAAMADAPEGWVA